MASLNGTPLSCEKVTETVNDHEVDVWEITAYNSQGYELPSSGGPGNTLFYLAGIALILLAGAVPMRRKREF
ncbi:MAG: LPXTG cell wall anchor domain-containing protein [Eubacteriales bacterium]|nr:LPXTG cell wall anchor domain-containing protein [Eubacteriales bacterium]